MRKLLLSAAVLLTAASTSLKTIASDSENKSASLMSVSGQVVDYETGEALAGVLVKIEESGSALYTDFEGKFEITDLYPGRYSINASYISYQVRSMDLDVNGEEKELIKITLNQASLK